MRRSRWLLVLLLIAVVGGVAVVVGYGSYTEAGGEIVSLDRVPEPLVKKAKDTLPDVKFDHARRLSNGNYEVRGKAKNGKVREVEMTPGGEVVEIE